MSKTMKHINEEGGRLQSQPSVDISPIWTPVIITDIKRLQRRQV
jgi:hypothetical protein